ncbi:MAG: Dam family site-specific DNA-(adenine-N6)-methyltransferase [Bacillota bacterium]|jgi:DNA adenine methylase|nr:Dam family site-specific DNA-(adenine-N6)-methyltransferase [Bacillota bacterium]
MKKLNISPFVKWAGGKRQLLEDINKRMPKNYNRYYEPFVGGGAVLFYLQPKDAIINDINKALMNAYRQIKKSPIELIKAIEELDGNIPEDGKAYYYDIRQRFNDKLMQEDYDIELAAMFIFINKHCFNGLYRVNGKGLFNVPYNNSRQASYNAENIMEISKYLKNVTILDGDFEYACKSAKEGDFIFFDSPYAPLNPSTFESYTKEGFDKDSHIRLAELFKKMTIKGCHCMLTNHNTEFINELYNNIFEDNSKYKIYIDIVSVKRMINSDANNRKGEEVIIYNYKV